MPDDLGSGRLCRSVDSGPRVPGGHRCVASITTCGASLKITVTVTLVHDRVRSF